MTAMANNVTNISKTVDELKTNNPLQLCLPQVLSILPTAFTKNFELKKYTIQYKAAGWNQIIINEKIPFNTNYILKIKIVKTQLRYIMVGAVDIQKQKGAANSHQSNNAVAYYILNGNKYPNMGI